MIRCLLLLCLLAAPAAAQPIALTGPDAPIEPRDYVQVVVDLPVAVLQTARVEISPTGPTLTYGYTWTGQAFVGFQARSAGTYTLSVTTNGWRKSLDAAVADAVAAGVPADSLRAATQELAARYPLRTGACVLEVAPQNPTPPAPQNPPPAASPIRATYVYEKDQSAVPKPIAAALAQLNRRAAEPGGPSVVATEFEDDALNGDDEPPAQYAAALAAARKAGLPALVLERSGKVRRVLQAPTRLQEVIDAVEAVTKEASP